MTAALAALFAFIAYFLAYRFYARFLANKIFQLNPDRKTPAHTLSDGVDYVPSRTPVLFGHHYASITGLAPMLGPAVAVIWGWFPAMLWVVLGAIFIGCVHDFSALVLSVRAQGKSVGKIAEAVIGRRARTLFLLIIFFGIALAMGVFVFVIGKLLAQPADGGLGYNEAALPSGLLMVIAATAGYLLYKKKFPFAPVIAVGFVLELGSIWLGLEWKDSFGSWPAPDTWMYILLGYAFLASVLPVWTLLQPRDFLNSLLLYLGLGLAYLGLFVSNPSFDAPALVTNPTNAPAMFPFVFIIIACGAASGFHGLVSSGTTAKQLDREPQARVIGYGGMVGESLLGLLAVLACTAGFSAMNGETAADVWSGHYGDYDTIAQNLPAKLGHFIEGTTSFLTSLGISAELASALIAMVVVSFALTTLDSATRLLRFNIEELSSTYRVPVLTNRYVSSLLACLVIGFFAFYKVDGKSAGLALWALFGSTNQLLAGLTLVLVTLYLKHRDKPTWYTGIPAVFMMSSTVVAMVINLKEHYQNDKTLLFIVGSILLLLGVGILFEAIAALRRPTKTDDPEIHFDTT
ncbi:MAG: carbon starvation protein A [Myxococcales bacterium]|nr:carbon starvation protein A [Myxococcales bacterium]